MPTSCDAFVLPDRGRGVLLLKEVEIDGIFLELHSVIESVGPDKGGIKMGLNFFFTKVMVKDI